uniref:Uncharacterized protein n=1 Tax=Globisporangium ultimum (strain ATCC 200006 / CBS 805.95 / DAOM BR144) TaxID=431595 RepID=K3WQC9_GLOUD
MAIHNMDQYHTIEPNVYVNFGPYAYAGSTFYKWSNNNVTSPKPVALWSYKYDTTSLAMRAFADYLNVSAFPKCVLYKSECGADFKIAPAAGYSMIDSLVYAIQNASTSALTSKHSTSTQPARTQLGL